MEKRKPQFQGNETLHVIRDRTQRKDAEDAEEGEARKGERGKGKVRHLAPEGRHVYRKPHTPNNQSPRGATCDSVKRKGNLTQGRKDAKNAEEEKKEGDA